MLPCMHAFIHGCMFCMHTKCMHACMWLAVVVFVQSIVVQCLPACMSDDYACQMCMHASVHACIHTDMCMLHAYACMHAFLVGDGSAFPKLEWACLTLGWCI